MCIWGIAGSENRPGDKRGEPTRLDTRRNTSRGMPPS